MTTPRIYIADLAAYNAGHLHGAWADATDADAIAETAAKVLATSPVFDAEELAIHDYDNFAGIRIEEYQSFETVTAHALALLEHGPAYASYVTDVDDSPAAPDNFADAYLGHYPSAGDYAAELLESTGSLDQVPAELQPYLDLDAYGRDILYDLTSVTRDGGLDLFA